MITTYEIIERLEFIKGNVIADERRDALQQIKELMQLLYERQEAELKLKARPYDKE